MLEQFRKFVSGYEDKHLAFTYQGDISSANKIYASPSWHYRKTLKDKFTRSFLEILSHQPIQRFKEFSMVVFYNSRHDVDNLSLLVKIAADTMKGVYFDDDNSKIYKSIHILIDKSLDKNTVEFHLLGN